MLEKQVSWGNEVRVSLYADGSFDAAYREQIVRIVEDGTTVSETREFKPFTNRDELVAALGEAAVSQREHVDAVEAKLREERAAWAAEIAALTEALVLGAAV